LSRSLSFAKDVKSSYNIKKFTLIIPS
jgi:hypothetical protein